MQRFRQAEYWMGLSVAGAVAAGVLVSQLVVMGRIPFASGTMFLVLAGSAVAGCAAAMALRAARAANGRSRTVWALMAAGSLVWAAGCVPYCTYLLGGGDPATPAAWTQTLYLLAYPLWYAAILFLRQPPSGMSRRERTENLVLEVTAFLVGSVVIAGLFWRDSLTTSENLSQLIPLMLTWLLAPAIYMATRRADMSRSSAYFWLTAGIVALMASDATLSYFVPRGDWRIGGLALNGYVIAFALLAIAARRPLRLTTARASGSRAQTAIGIIALALIIPASAETPRAWLVLWIPLAALLAGRLLMRAHSHLALETDGATGLLEGPAFVRQMVGMESVCPAHACIGLIMIDEQGSERRYERLGVRAADEWLNRFGAELEAIAETDGGVWCRASQTRFAWAGFSDPAQLTARAEAFITRLTLAFPDVPVRASVVAIPYDVDRPHDALDAAHEGIDAAFSLDRQIVSYERGQLEGAIPMRPTSTSARRRRERLAAAMCQVETITPVFQPIVRLADGVIVGHEALSRFHVEPSRSPDKWFAEAAAVGLGDELEAECIRRAFAHRPEMPAGTYLSVNASARIAESGGLADALPDEPLGWLVIEITEHDRVDTYDALNAALAPLRARGARIAIDDAGAGHSSMRHILQMRPDIIKLDRSLVDGIPDAAEQQAAVESFLSLASRVGAVLVAEGIETDQEQALLRDMGVHFGQGYGLARPNPALLAALPGRGGLAQLPAPDGAITAQPV